MRLDLGYEALRYLIDEVVFMHHADRRVVFVSPSVENVLGYSEEEFTRLVTVDLVHPDDLFAVANTATSLRRQEGSSYRQTLRVRRADGTFVWCEVIGRNLLHTEVAGVINTLRGPPRARREDPARRLPVGRNAALVRCHPLGRRVPERGGRCARGPDADRRPGALRRQASGAKPGGSQRTLVE
jgi:PAS domain S-box-containing protein